MEVTTNKKRTVSERSRRYDSYKDSGVEWLGEIPEHWETRRIKYIFNEINERSEDGNEDLLSVSQYTGVTNKSDKVEAGGILTNAETLEGYKKVAKGDLVSNIMLAWNGSLGFSPFNGITSPAYSIYRIYGENDNRYFHYLLRTELYKAEFKRNSSGVIESRLRLYTDDFFKIEAILPPQPEQTAIAQFLDDKTTKIDQAIAIKQQQIALLKERKQILIHKAVTRGLNDNVALKDSGVEWIGEIPEHWEVCDFKRVIDLIKDGTHGTYQRVTEGRVLLSAKNVHSDGIKISGEESLINEKDYQEITKNGFPKKGDLLVTCVGTIGRAFVYDRDESIAFQRSVAFLRLNKLKAIPEFFKIYVESSLYQFALKQLTKTSAQGGVYMGDIMNSTIIFPPLSEQKEIANYIETASAKIETAISLKEQEISKLQEYKSSLINSVVTGKVRVC